MELFFFFFFQAEDGIRDLYVTGVQTCALPILTFAAEPRQPACAAPTASGAVSRTGTQSAVWIARPTPESRVTRASHAPASTTRPAAGVSSTVTTRAPWTWVARTIGSSGYPRETANRRARAAVGEGVSGGAAPRSETAAITPSGRSIATKTAFGTSAFSTLFTPSFRGAQRRRISP